MNQSTPNHDDRPDQQQGVESNPYYANRPASPDLDAGSPVLRSVDVQRLNRKALWFLAGIVGLLVLAAIWLFSSAMSDDDAKKTAPVGEKVIIPDAPREDRLPPPADPVVLPPADPLPLAGDYDQPSPAPVFPQTQPSAFQVRDELSLLERRMLNSAGGGVGQGGLGGGSNGMMGPDEYAQRMNDLRAGGAAGQQQGGLAGEGNDVASAQPLYNADTLLLRGTYIRCVLETRIVTDVAGFTSCVVTEPVYSVNGRRMLLPKGSKVSGKYNENAIGGERVAVIWDRITTPTGLNVNMRSPGVDNLGGAGHPGHYDAHWGEKIASALLISMLSDAFKYAGAKHGPQQAEVINGAIVQSPYESNTARTMERLANMALDKSMSRPATVTINQGTVLNVYVARDVDFSAVLQ